jgi:hypothetical protein
VTRVCSIFSQLLQLFPGTEFEKAVQEHKAERHARGFAPWGQFLAMLFCQLGRAHSLNKITQGLAASEGKLKHLGLPPAPKRSTLAYANQPSLATLPNRLRATTGAMSAVGGRRPAQIPFKNKLVSLDATVIDLCLTLYGWAQFRRTKEPSSCICCWIMMAICPALPA